MLLAARFVSIKTMQITIEKKLDKEVRNASRTLGVDKSRLIERAVLFYLDSVKKSMNLKQELDAWEKLSDESFSAVDYAKR